jgi:gas vesicle protein
MKKNNKISDGKMMAGAAAGAAAIGAGAYYLFGPNGKANQKKVKALATKIKNEVKKEVKKAKEVSTPIYNKAVDVISENYAKQYKLHEKDIKFLADKIKSEWKDISGKAKKAVRQTKTKVKRAAKKKI